MIASDCTKPGGAETRINAEYYHIARTGHVTDKQKIISFSALQRVSLPPSGR